MQLYARNPTFACGGIWGSCPRFLPRAQQVAHAIGGVAKHLVVAFKLDCVKSGRGRGLTLGRVGLFVLPGSFKSLLMRVERGPTLIVCPLLGIKRMRSKPNYGQRCLLRLACLTILLLVLLLGDGLRNFDLAC